MFLLQENTVAYLDLHIKEKRQESLWLRLRFTLAKEFNNIFNSNINKLHILRVPLFINHPHRLKCCLDNITNLHLVMVHHHNNINISLHNNTKSHLNHNNNSHYSYLTSSNNYHN